MDKIIIHDTSKITLWCYPSLKLIHHQMHGACYNEPFREALTAGTDALIEHGADRWLSDDRENGPLSPEDEEWATRSGSRAPVTRAGSTGRWCCR